MADNIDLFKDEIKEIKEYSELDGEVFREILGYVRVVAERLGNSISPVAVVDLIEESVEHMMYDPPVMGEEITVRDAVGLSVENIFRTTNLEDRDYETADQLLDREIEIRVNDVLADLSSGELRYNDIGDLLDDSFGTTDLFEDDNEGILSGNSSSNKKM